MPRTPSRSLAIPHPRTFLYSYLLLVPAACTHKVPSALHPYTRRTRTCHTQCSSSFSSGTVRLGCRGIPPSYSLQFTVYSLQFPPSYNPSDAARASYIFFIVASVCVAAVTSHVRLFSSVRLDAVPPARGADFSSSDPSWTASTCFGAANFCQDAL